MTAVWSRDGRSLYYIADLDGAANIWSVNADGTDEHPMTDLTGKRGRFNPDALTTDGTYLYFVWNETLGDIWVMDVVQE